MTPISITCNNISGNSQTLHTLESVLQVPDFQHEVYRLGEQVAAGATQVHLEDRGGVALECAQQLAVRCSPDLEAVVLGGGLYLLLAAGDEDAGDSVAVGRQAELQLAVLPDLEAAVVRRGDGPGAVAEHRGVGDCVGVLVHLQDVAEVHVPHNRRAVLRGGEQE